jgi:hypothetical protein
MMPLFASHTMPSLGELFGEIGPVLAAGGLLAAPCVVASSRGVKAVAELRFSRHLLTMLAGTTLGMLAILSAAAAAVAIAPGGWIALAGVALGGLGGAVVAFRVARFLATKWNWYTCGACGVWFQARIEAERCPGCDAVQDRLALADALAEFDQRFEQVQLPPGP